MAEVQGEGSMRHYEQPGGHDSLKEPAQVHGSGEQQVQRGRRALVLQQCWPCLPACCRPGTQATSPVGCARRKIEG